MVGMAVQYYKRFRMEIDLRRRYGPRWIFPHCYRAIGWDPSFLEIHAETKYLSFRSEIDAHVFPCLGERAGCMRLMDEISRKEGFLPDATWLVACEHAGREHEYCGTIQGIQDEAGTGTIQNLGVLPAHRGQGLGAFLLQRALDGFRHVGLTRGSLEVTAQNKAAIRLYERMGFFRCRTLYKAVEVALH